MAASAAAYKAADADQNGLDFDEFCTMPQNRGKPRPALRAAFDEADSDKSGTIDKSEFLRMALVDALSSSEQRVIDLLEQARTAPTEKPRHPHFLTGLSLCVSDVAARPSCSGLE